ncbi:MAG: hypothetical protein GY749_05080 [Desulfobacteraceae bacterium]|nr:hypothetical protein [Desulfobacteraceae bacterium]
MLINTKLKDRFLLAILYLLATLACLYGWFFLNMRWEFLAGTILFIMSGCYKLGDKTAGIIIGIISGGFVGALSHFEK